MSPKRDVSMTRDELRAFLSVPRTGVLTTLDVDGWPHSTAMWFVPEDDALLMWTYAKSQKAVNLLRDPRCSFVVEEGHAYSELKGVLIRGRAEELDDYQAIRAVGVALYDRYTKESVGVDVEDGPIVEIERQAHKRLGFRVPFERVTSWDHAKL